MDSSQNAMTSVSNKEALRDKIHEIHNYLRNNGAGYGMNALKVFNILYGLKKIEENKLFDKVNLVKPDCEFSYLLILANENKDERLAELIFGNVLQSICDSELRDILFYEIPQNIKGSVFAYLIKEIDRITIIEKTCNVLLSGKIYEYFIGRDESAISELGAYFTDRHITKYILQKANPTKNEDGTIPTMIDMFGGSGGFTTEYINYLNEKYPQLINWTTEINKIYHYDMNEDVIKSAGLEFFCLTGVLPNMNNLKYKNSFTDEFNGNKYMYVFTNPPYGGDKSSKTEAQNKREKVKAYIKNELLTITDADLKIRRQKQLKSIEIQERQDKKESDKTKVSITSCSGRIQKFAKEYKLKGNDKESCSLILLMDMVEVGGTAVGVLKEGVFFNKIYKDLRKCLVENFNVREIISIPQDQFENTSTKTSIVIFDNTKEKTSDVIFSDLIVERYTEDKFVEMCGDIILIENKDDIVKVSDKLVSQATKTEISENATCSLNGRAYNKKVITVSEGYELVKLSDVCEFMPKSKRYASFGQPTGQYNFYTSSDKVQKCDIADYNEECLIIGSGGVANIKIDNQFSCSTDNLLLKSQYNTYLYSFFKDNMSILSDGFIGSTLKHLSKDYLKNIKVPIPKSQSRIKEWEYKISIPYNEKSSKVSQIEELEMSIQNKINENKKYEEVELGSVCEYIKTGKNKTPDNKNGTLYPYYGTANITGYTDHYLFDGKHILVARNGTMGNCFLVDGKIYPSDHIFVIRNNESIDILTLYYLIKSISSEIQNSSNGSIIKGISKENLSKIIIKNPTDDRFIQELKNTYQQIEILQNNI
jgi:type I restriction-modification system DNA methylase subunit